jgi:ABC-type uncharacterized transport system permease subunit
MAYNATYVEGDLAEASINGIVKVILTVGSLITLVVLVFMFVYIKKKVKG